MDREATYQSADVLTPSTLSKQLDFDAIHGKLLAWQARGSVDDILRPVSLTTSITPPPSLSDDAINYLSKLETVEEYIQESSMLSALRFDEDRARESSKPGLPSTWTEGNNLWALEVRRLTEDYLQMKETLMPWRSGGENVESEELVRLRLERIRPLLRVYDALWEAFFQRHPKLRSLTQPSFDGETLWLPSLASSSSESLHHDDSSAKPSAKSNKGFKVNVEYDLFRQQRQQQWEREQEEKDTMRNEVSRFNWKPTYSEESLELTEHRAAEDLDRTERRAAEVRDGDSSANRPVYPWNKVDQRALEYQRVENDYLRLMEKLLDWTNSNDENAFPETLALRQRYVRILLREYDALWEASSIRLQGDKDEQPQQPRPDTTEQCIEGRTEEERNTDHANTGKRTRGRPRRGQPKTEHAIPTGGSETQTSGNEITDAETQHPDPPRHGYLNTKRVRFTDSSVHPGKITKSTNSRKSGNTRLQSASIPRVLRRSARTAQRT